MKEIANELLYGKGEGASPGILIAMGQGNDSELSGQATVIGIPLRVQPICAPLKHGIETVHKAKIVKDYSNAEEIKDTILDLAEKDCPISVVVIQVDGIGKCDLDVLISAIKNCEAVEETAMIVVRTKHE